MTINKVLKKFTGVNEIRINSLNLGKTADGSDKLVIHVEPYKSKQCRCHFHIKKQQSILLVPSEYKELLKKQNT